MMGLALMARTLCSAAIGRGAHCVIIALLLAVLTAGTAWAVGEQEVYIRKDNTPLFAAPSTDAKVVLRANAGHRLFVLDRDADWLKVYTPQYMLVGEDMWVKADVVGPPPERPEAPPAPAPAPAAPGFHLAV